MRNIHELPCWKCSSSDGVTLYRDEPERQRLHCFVCDSTTFDKDKIEEWSDMEPNVTQLQPPQAEKKKVFPKRGIISSIEDRKITKETCEKYGVEKLFHPTTNKPYAYSFPAHDNGNNFVAQKIKAFDGRVQWLGEPNKAGLYGKHLFSQGGKYITVTEGEEDMLAAYQMLQKFGKGNFDTPVVSIKDGAGSALKDFKRDWEFLNSFDNIIICFDGDQPGRKAAKECAKLFPYKVKIVHFPQAKKVEDKWQDKDACDYLSTGKENEFVKLWWNAEKFVPKGVKTFRSLWDDMTEKDSNVIVPFPWDSLNKMCQGMITSKMDVWKAHPKVGKTTILSELVMHIKNNSEYNAGVIFLENTAEEIGFKFCGIDMNQPLDRPDLRKKFKEDAEFRELVKPHHEAISENDRITIFDPADERTTENLYNKILYFNKAHDCKFIFLDHASMFAYTSDSMDERKFLDKLFADLKQMTTTLDIYLGVVIHVNDDGKTRGSRAPIQLCDRLFALERDKLNPDEIISNTTEIIVEENRYGQSGLGTKLYYDQDTGRVRELDMDLIMDGQKRDDLSFDE